MIFDSQIICNFINNAISILSYKCDLWDIDVFNKIDSYDPNVMKYLSKFQKQYLQDKLPEYFYIPFGRCGNYKMDNLELFALIANIAINEMKGW